MNRSSVAKQRPWLALLFCLLALVGFGAFCGFYYYHKWQKTPLALSQPTEIELSRGQSLKSFANNLDQQELVEHPILFRLLARSRYHQFKAGRYRFSESVTPLQIQKDLIEGNTYNPVVVQWTIPEGFTLQKIAKRLEALEVGTYPEILRIAKDKDFLKINRLQFAKSLEGFLYPATYPFYQKPTTEEALQTMVTEFWRQLPTDYEAQVKKLGLSLYDAIIFASLIELETKLDEERPMVAEVIWNRLKKKMPLAIDAAIIYGIPNYDGDIRTRDLKNIKNPYNTRIHSGLPPTPIGSPSLKSMLAILNPTDFGYFYYVLQKPGEDAHYFSKTLSEHNRRVQEFLKKH